MNKLKKGQVSVEYLFIVAMALAIIIPGSMIFMNYTRESNEKVIASQINNIGNNLINAVERIYDQGKNSWITLDINFPEATTDVIINDYEIVIKYTTPRGITDAVFFTDVNMSSPYGESISDTFRAGYMAVKIESRGDYILVGENIS